MIAAKDKPTNLTPEEYFAWEEKQLEKHELINGQVYPMGIYAMTDGSKNHSLLAARLITLFTNHLEGSGCDFTHNFAATGIITLPSTTL